MLQQPLPPRSRQLPVLSLWRWTYAPSFLKIGRIWGRREAGRRKEGGLRLPPPFGGDFFCFCFCNVKKICYILNSFKNVNPTCTPGVPPFRYLNTLLNMREITTNQPTKERDYNRTNRSWVNFGGRHFCRKIYVWKNNKMPHFTWHLPENTEYSRILHDICPKMPDFMTFARKIFFPIFFAWGGHVPLYLPLSQLSQPREMNRFSRVYFIDVKKRFLCFFIKVWKHVFFNFLCFCAFFKCRVFVVVTCIVKTKTYKLTNMMHFHRQRLHFLDKASVL